MNITNLKYFVEVADMQNFSKAALKNHISQTAISQQIAKLERELDTKLFHRSTLPVQLTISGKRVYRRAQVILDQYSMMRQDIEEVKLQKYIFRIAYPMGFKVPLENIVLPAFIKLKDVEFDFEKADLDDMQELLLRNMLDFALCFDSEITDRNRLAILKLFHGKFDVLVGANNKLSNYDEITPSMLKDQKLIYIKGNHQSNTYKRMQQYAVDDNAPIEINHFVNDIETALILTSMNKGIMLIPDFYKIQSDSLNLHRLHLKGSRQQFEVCLAYRKNNRRVLNLIPKLKKVISIS